MNNWNQYRQNTGGRSSGKYYEQTQLKVIDLGTRHPKNNWWNGFIKATKMEDYVVTESGEAIPAKGLCIVEQVVQFPFYSEKDHCWLVSVQFNDMDQSDGSFRINGLCELGFADYAEAGQVKKGILFYKHQRK